MSQKREARVLLVDDKVDMLSMLRLLTAKKCHCAVEVASNGGEALEKIKVFHPDLVVTDIKMPGMDGLTLLAEIKKYDANISVIMMTGYGSVETAVAALQQGAYDFLQKPFEKDHFVRVVSNCLERVELINANQHLHNSLKKLQLPEGIVGESEALAEAYKLIGRVAETDATVLIRGESGTGKEMAAKSIHNFSPRHNKSLVVVNCPAIPESILESELFGYSRGAFTGASQAKKGLFLEAEAGTIILDEVADIPLSVQTKLLRVLQEKEIQPLGQNHTIAIDVRVVASTNQDLEAKIREGSFREDLYYRLNVVTITLPGIEQRRDDIPLLVQHYFQHYCEKYQRHGMTLSPEVALYLQRRAWPGNIRELRNYIKRLVIVQDEKLITLGDLPDEVAVAAGNSLYEEALNLSYRDAKSMVVNDFSRLYLSHYLQKHGGNVTQAAAEAGVERQGFQRLMRGQGLTSAQFKVGS